MREDWEKFKLEMILQIQETFFNYVPLLASSLISKFSHTKHDLLIT